MRWVRLGLRLPALVLHLLCGVLLAGLVFPRLGRDRRARIIETWSRRLLALLGVRMSVQGRVPQDAGVVFVANHISWLDVWLINSQRACRFVAKAEVRDWPVIGWLAEKAGTLFIERERRHHTAALNPQIAAALASGDCVALFPEGTTSDGRQLRRFFTSLFQPVADTGTPLVPVAIRYVDAAGNPDITPAYIDQMTLMHSLMRILAAGEIRAELHVLPPIDTRGLTRREIAHAAEAAIRAALCLPAPDTTPETPPGR